MLDAGQQSMFAKAVGSLPLESADTLLCLMNAQQSQSYDVKGFVNHEVQELGCEAHVELIVVPKTRGQLETAFFARDWIGSNEQLAIFNIDTAFVSSTLGARFAGRLLKLDGVLGGFPPDGLVNWSFASIKWKEGERVVTRTAEKSFLPGFALTGLYHFSRSDTFFSAALEELNEPVGATGEYYIAPIYNRLIASGLEFVIDVVDSITHMGTPEHLKLARMEYIDNRGK
jgi:hypothetical protein